ncbi:hypothetical protein PTQ19_11800 [Microbacterium esteraromaticum]|nr:hypothetical protein [Microbacterium esteraromaticum]WDH78195.1 hypothetical protein PTQ19_11800 [Microbacterium esteraromaticum]
MSKRQIIERAVTLYDHVHEETQRGRRVHLVDPSGTEPPNCIIFL